MRAIVNTPAGAGIAPVDDPRPEPDEALVRVHAFSINRGELALLKARTEQWRPGQDIAGVVIRAADDGSGPAIPRTPHGAAVRAVGLRRAEF